MNNTDSVDNMSVTDAVKLVTESHAVARMVKQEMYPKTHC